MIAEISGMGLNPILLLKKPVLLQDRFLFSMKY
jgi:hypothetical protein